MKINTTRFGEIEVPKEEIINFPEGILGFEKFQEFYIVDPNDRTLVVWLQSTTTPHVAFPIIEPTIFRPDFKIELVPHDLESLSLETLQGALIYTILTIPQDVTLMTANLKAPIIINQEKRIGRQIVLQDNKPSLRFEMYKELKKYLVAYESDDSKRTNVVDPEIVNNAAEVEFVAEIKAEVEAEAQAETLAEAEAKENYRNSSINLVEKSEL